MQSELSLTWAPGHDCTYSPVMFGSLSEASVGFRKPSGGDVKVLLVFSKGSQMLLEQGSDRRLGCLAVHCNVTGHCDVLCLTAWALFYHVLFVYRFYFGLSCIFVIYEVLIKIKV